MTRLIRASLLLAMCTALLTTMLTTGGMAHAAPAMTLPTETAPTGGMAGSALESTPFLTEENARREARLVAIVFALNGLVIRRREELQVARENFVLAMRRLRSTSGRFFLDPTALQAARVASAEFIAARQRARFTLAEFAMAVRALGVAEGND